MEARTRPCRFSHNFLASSSYIIPKIWAKGQHYAMVSVMLANVATRTSLRWTAMVSILQATFRSFSKPLRRLPTTSSWAIAFLPNFLRNKLPICRQRLGVPTDFPTSGCGCKRAFLWRIHRQDFAPIPCIASTDWTFSPIATRRNWKSWCSRLGVAQDCDRFP